VAVIQISRIQVRRGKKDPTGIPQLASGEFGWAVDSQELYIGNGSVAEGSPYVGNTKILSENDNLFAFAKNYTYKSTGSIVQTGSSSTNPTERSLQDRLDDIVSAASFGVTGDGVTDDTVAIQRAIDQLYLNNATKLTAQSRVVLVFDAGEYIVTDTIKIPPYANIRGAGIDKTIFKVGNESTGGITAFLTINDSSTPGTYSADSTSTSLNQARHIHIEGLTIEHGAFGAPNALMLQSCKDSLFRNLKLVGNWIAGYGLDATHSGIKLNSLSTAVNCTNNKFENITITKFSYGIYTDFDIEENVWKDCKFTMLQEGVSFGLASSLAVSGQLTGPMKNVIEGSNFDNIYGSALMVTNGKYNASRFNHYNNVANELGVASNAVAPIIKFVSPGGTENVSTDDFFQRSSELGHDGTYLINTPYIIEVDGPTINKMVFTHTINVGYLGTEARLFKLPMGTTTGKNASGYEVDYIYRSDQVNAVRSGKLTIVTDPVNDTIAYTDEYDFTGDFANAENLNFIINNYDDDSDLSLDTVGVNMLNSTVSDDAKFTYTVKTKS
jgi:hypothetical protein